MIFAMIFRGIFRKFPENINKTLIAARPLSARDSCNVLCLFGFGVVDKKMLYTICKYTKKVIFVRIIMNRKRILIVMAAGSGVRMGATVPKQFLDLGGVPILRRTIEAFISVVPDIKVVTVLPGDHIAFWKDYCLVSDFNCPQTLVPGGFTRFHSVRNALKKVPDGAVVAIHDGVRPLLSPKLIGNMFERMDSGGVRALIPVIPSVDTLKVIDRVKDADGNEILVSPEGENVDRSRIFGAQTPQMFLSEDIKSAYSQAFDTAFTDDASVARKKGIPLSFCAGERYNFKLTSPEDLALARLIISSSSRTR